MHAPEFAFEKVTANVSKAVTEADIKYPVALDNDFATWRAFHNRYWPAKYLIDQDGTVRYTHFGEGAYDETEAGIRELLGATGDTSSPQTQEPGAARRSPETYLGTGRASGFSGSPQLHDGTDTYTPEPSVRPDGWTLGGKWSLDGESITADEDGATLTYVFRGSSMYLVMGGPSGSSVKVDVGGQDPGGADVIDGTADVSDSRLYRLVELPSPSEGTTVTLTFSKGVRANAFTFG